MLLEVEVTGSKLTGLFTSCRDKNCICKKEPYLTRNQIPSEMLTASIVDWMQTDISIMGKISTRIAKLGILI
jgi:hypothetical protein